MSAPRVLVCGRLPAAGRAALEGAGLQVDHQPDRAAGSLADVIEPYAGVIVHSPHRVDAAALEAARHLKVVGRAGVGVDNIDVEAATARGVLVMNLPWGNTVSAAEHTLALLLALVRHVPQANAALRAGRWDRKAFLGNELAGKVLGIVGLGRIGRAVARRALALEMRLLGSDPFLPASVAEELGIELVPLPELLGRVDILTLHVPRTADTRHLIDARAIAALKPGARLINCARGGLVDEAALLAALESGHLAGAACDVFEHEPTDNEALLRHPHFVATPHLGGATREARERVGEGIARQVAEYLSQGTIRHAVNVQTLPPEQQRALGPYLELGRAMGALLSQCFDGIESLRVEYSGDLAQYELHPLTAWILTGFLRPFLGETVNVVNAARLAADRGLQVQEVCAAGEHGYSSLVRVEAKAGDSVHSVAGTVFEGKVGRLVELEGLPIEIAPCGNLLVFENEDTPGVVGRVGGFLAARGINIADMRLGRTGPGGRAIGAMTLDEPLDEDGLTDLLAQASIRWARTVRL